VCYFVWSWFFIAQPRNFSADLYDYYASKTQITVMYDFSKIVLLQTFINRDKEGSK